MNEEEWLSSNSPLKLLMHARRNSPTLRTSAGRRKFRLFGVGCTRRIWSALREGAQRGAVEVAEQFADGVGIWANMWFAWEKALDSEFGPGRKPLVDVLYGVCDDETWEAAKVWRVTSGVAFNVARGNKPDVEKRQIAALARCIFGNPFRSVAFDPAWRTSDVVALARGIYDDRAFDRMPILADALQDAGCDNDDILTHCRDTNTPHARGCWVVDLVLGKA